MTEIERALRHPLTWITGGIVSIVSVVSALAVDPISFTSAIIEVFIANASMVFTASSIAGFTIGPEISSQVANAFTLVAIIAGAIVVLKLVSQLWDRLKEKVT